jgi:hypothetical protein
LEGPRLGGVGVAVYVVCVSVQYTYQGYSSALRPEPGPSSGPS